MRSTIVAAAVIVSLGMAAEVRAQNAPPVAHEVHLTTTMATAASGTLEATDPNGDPLTFAIVVPPIKGTVVLTDMHSGAFTYTPGVLQNGADRFTFAANDGVTTSAAAPVDIVIGEANTTDVALRKGAIGDTSDRVNHPGAFPAPEIVDGDLSTSWNGGQDGRFVIVGLGEAKRVSRIVIHWADGHRSDSYDIYINGEVICSTTGDTRYGPCDMSTAVDPAHGTVDTITLAANAPTDAVEIFCGRPPSELTRVYEIQEVEVYATESLDHASRNPPHAAGGDLHDAATFAALTDGDPATGVVGDFSSPPLQFLITTVYPAPEITRIALFWGDAYASHYQVIASADCSSTTRCSPHRMPRSRSRRTGRPASATADSIS